LRALRTGSGQSRPVASSAISGWLSIMGHRYNLSQGLLPHATFDQTQVHRKN
jgi:hypothetical protein